MSLCPAGTLPQGVDTGGHGAGQIRLSPAEACFGHALDGRKGGPGGFAAGG